MALSGWQAVKRTVRTQSAHRFGGASQGNPCLPFSTTPTGKDI